MHILNYNSSFLLVTDSFSFNIFKRLYHASFKLNVVNVSRALSPWSPTEPTEGFTENPGTQLCFISQFMEKAEFFSVPAKTLVPAMKNDKNTITAMKMTNTQLLPSKMTNTQLLPSKMTNT